MYQVIQPFKGSYTHTNHPLSRLLPTPLWLPLPWPLLQSVPSAHPKPRGLPLVDYPLLVLLTSQTLVPRFEHHVQPIPFAVHIILCSFCLHICTLNLYFVLSLILEFVNSEFLYIHQLADNAATTLYLVMYLALFTNRVEVIFMSSFEQPLPCHW